MLRLPPNPEDKGWVQSRKDTVTFWTIVVMNYDVDDIFNLNELIDYDVNLRKWQDNHDA